MTSTPTIRPGSVRIKPEKIAEKRMGPTHRWLMKRKWRTTNNLMRELGRS